MHALETFEWVFSDMLCDKIKQNVSDLVVLVCWDCFYHFVLIAEVKHSLKNTRYVKIVSFIIELVYG